MYTIADASTIRIKPTTGGTTFEWVGESNYVAISFQLLEEGNPDDITFCSHDVIFVGDVGAIGPYRLRVAGVDMAHECIFLERVVKGPVWKRAQSSTLKRTFCWQSSDIGRAICKSLGINPSLSPHLLIDVWPECDVYIHVDLVPTDELGNIDWNALLADAEEVAKS